MTHAQRVLDQLKAAADDDETPDELKGRLNERIQELTTDMYDLTGFQRDVLRGIATMTTDDNDREQPPHGLALKTWLENAGYGDVHHGRLYPNLDDLTDMGLVSKGQLDKRTNSYSLTERGKREVKEWTDNWTEAAHGLNVEGDD